METLIASWSSATGQNASQRSGQMPSSHGRPQWRATGKWSQRRGIQHKGSPAKVLSGRGLVRALRQVGVLSYPWGSQLHAGV